MVKTSKRKIIAQAGKVASLGSILNETRFRPLGRRMKVKVGLDQPPLPSALERNSSACLDCVRLRERA